MPSTDLSERLRAAHSFGSKTKAHARLFKEAAEAIEKLEMLVAASIALAWSESGTADQLRGVAAIYEPWAEMDEMIRVLDDVRPGWRAQEPPNA